MNNWNWMPTGTGNILLSWLLSLENPPTTGVIPFLNSPYLTFSAPLASALSQLAQMTSPLWKWTWFNNWKPQTPSGEQQTTPNLYDLYSQEYQRVRPLPQFTSYPIYGNLVR